jgi:phage FluMu protein Com
MPGSGVPRTVRCPHCGRVHGLVIDARGVRCAGCERVFWLDDNEPSY